MTVQSLDRGVELLRLLANAGDEGCRLVELQRETGLSKPTVHRLLKALKSHALVDQLDDSRRYCLGPEIAVLGWLMSRRLSELKKRCEEEMAALAESTGDTTFLAVPAGREAICIDRHVGPCQPATFTIDVGVRSPLGIGATGIALLASMPPPQADRIVDASERALAQYPASLPRIRAAVTHARRNGYALSDGTVLRGVRGVAMTVRNGGGKVVASVGVAATAARIGETRIPELLTSLRSGVRQIEKRLALAETGVAH